MCGTSSLWLLSLVTLLFCLPRALTIDEPIISDITKDILASVGEDVELNCTISHIGDLSVSWAKYIGESDSALNVLSMRDTLNLRNERYSIAVTKDEKAATVTYTYKIMKIETSDMGLYECQVNINLEKKVTKKLKLSIKHPAIISDDRTPKTMVVTEGQNLEVSCHATGFPQPTISWRREDNNIMPAGGHSQPGPILRVKEVHRLDRGAYYCIADNGVGKPDERLIRVEVEFRPQIAVLRPKVAQVLSYMAQLECNVQSYPAPTVTWHRNGTQLQSNSQYEITNMASSHETTSSMLKITSVSEEDYGDYFCNATNKLGNAEARLNLYKAVIPVPAATFSSIFV